MPLQGTSFLAIWNDVAPQAEDEWDAWHTEEHMPERVRVPGFLRARRYFDWNRTHHRYFTLYETERIEVLGSEAYTARLNDPTPWTQKMMPFFQNFIRGAGLTVSSVGEGIGGSLATVRITLADRKVGVDPSSAGALTAWLHGQAGVISAHIGVSDVAVTQIPSRERELRKTTQDDIYDAVVLVEAIGRKWLEQAIPLLRERLSPWSSSPVADAIYDLQYILEN